MNRTISARLLVSALFMVTLVTGCARPQTPGPEPTPAPVPAPPQVPQPPADPEQWVKYMTLDEKVGQLLWVGIPGTTVTAQTEQLLRTSKAGGVILFGRQGTDPATLQQLTSRMQVIVQGRERFSPLLAISIDQEGGRVERLTNPFTDWPGNMAIGATGSSAYAEQVARAMALEMLAVGINTDLAPDADVNVNPENPVIGVRSYGEDPKAVARLVSAAVKGFQSQSMGAVAKHFPGHGDTAVDSHRALPIITHTMEQLESIDLVPFRSAITSGVDAIMAAHIIFPAVATDNLPATLSPKVLQGFLKDKLGYQGVVITDAMDTMKAITENYGVENGLVMSIKAGADVVLITESYERQEALHDLVVTAVNDGRIPQARIDDAVRRIMAFKIKRGLVPGKQLKGPLTTVIGADEHKKLAQQVGTEALTLVRNKHLPLKLNKDQMVLTVGPAYAALDKGGMTALASGIKAYHENVMEVTTDKKPTEAQLSAIRRAADQAAVIVYGVYNGQDYLGHQALIKELVAAGKPVIVVGMGEPYDLMKLPQIQTYIAAYGYQTPNLQGVGALLMGKATPKGKLPVSIPNLYPIGHGLSF